MQAVVALSKLQDADAAEESDDDDSDQEDKTSVAEVLIDVLTHDPAAFVLCHCIALPLMICADARRIFEYK